MGNRANQPRKKGKKNRKHGRNRKFCERYRAENRRERNKRKKQIRHLKKHPNDVDRT